MSLDACIADKPDIHTLAVLPRHGQHVAAADDVATDSSNHYGSIQLGGKRGHRRQRHPPFRECISAHVVVGWRVSAR